MLCSFHRWIIVPGTHIHIHDLSILFFRRKVRQRSIFDDDSDEDLFSARKKTVLATSKETAPTKKASSIFDEPTNSSLTKKPTIDSIFDTESESTLQKAKHVEPSIAPAATISKQKPDKPKLQKSIFDESDSDGDLFSSSSSKNKVKPKVVGEKIFQSKSKPKATESSLFGNDSEGENDIFTSRKVVKTKETKPVPSDSGKTIDHSSSANISISTRATDTEVTRHDGIQNEHKDQKMDNVMSSLEVKSSTVDNSLHLGENESSNALPSTPAPALLKSMAKVSVAFILKPSWFLSTCQTHYYMCLYL